MSRLESGNFGFDLENRHAAGIDPKADEIDRPSFAISGVAHLRDHLPAACRQDASHVLLDARVARIQQAVDVPRAPEHVAVEACVDDLENRPDGRDRKSTEMPAFDE